MPYTSASEHSTSVQSSEPILPVSETGAGRGVSAAVICSYRGSASGQPPRQPERYGVKTRFKWTDDHTVLARKLRKQGLTWEEVAIRVGCSPNTVRLNIDPVYAEKCIANRERYRKKYYLKGSHTYAVRHGREESKNPAYDPKRDGEIEAPQSLTAALMGDPPPSRSALGRECLPDEYASKGGQGRFDTRAGRCLECGFGALSAGAGIGFGRDMP